MSGPIAMKEPEEIGIFSTAYCFKQLEHRKQQSASSITISHDNNANNALGERFGAVYLLVT
tara:strand:+ start:2389 stop:2571 length:183 start_codon:yes stop_codon:yes gene_type:complete